MRLIESKARPDSIGFLHLKISGSSKLKVKRINMSKIRRREIKREKDIPNEKLPDELINYF